MTITSSDNSSTGSGLIQERFDAAYGHIMQKLKLHFASHWLNCFKPGNFHEALICPEKDAAFLLNIKLELW